jgi:hypothetical protein
VNLTEISFSRVKAEIESFLRSEYSRASLSYSPASPFGQVLLVAENLYQLSILYMKNSITQMDMLNPDATNVRAIRNAAIFAGHIPSRSISATGTLQFSVKVATDINEDLPGGKITFNNRQSIKNKTNGLEYAVNIGTDQVSYIVNSTSKFYLPIIQGKWQRISFTGTGEENQTYPVSVRGTNIEIENFNYDVLVNGEYWTIKKHIYDLLPDEKACVVRTGFDGGIDVIFGNSGFGMVPPLSSVIEVNYLVSDGSSGSIFNRNLNDWTFIDEALDGFGNGIDVGNLFDVSIFSDINFGADKENPRFTKNILPIVSNNFVLGLPQQYMYQLKKLGIFSHVNAYENQGVVIIVATPNIKLFRDKNEDYFAVELAAFDLDDNEKKKIDIYLKSGGNIQLTKKYRIDSPVLSYYVMNVFVMTYSDAQEDAVNAQILSKVSDYFLNLTRTDRVPKSEILSEISKIQEIHSVDISFLSRKNEEYHKQAKLDDLNAASQYASQTAIQNQTPNPKYNPQTMLGLDPVLGDILFDPAEVPIIRGGWYDRNNFYYSDDINEKGLKTVNIINRGTVDSSKRQKI